VNCTFRVDGLQPELWNPLTGELRDLPDFRQADGRTTVPLEFAPYGSWFVVFRRSVPGGAAAGTGNFPGYSPVRELAGPWTVRFDRRWGGPASAVFPELVSWTTRSEAGIRFYSGTATYEKTLALPVTGDPARRIFLDLGEVRQIAEVRLNGMDLGILWSPPFRVEITRALRPGENRLEVDIVNFWPNRVIGDASVAAAERLTRTNIRKLTAESPLMESGLLGPVRLLAIADAVADSLR
jgi:hypothetical protein